MTELHYHVEDLYDQLSEHVTIDRTKLEGRLDTLVTEYKVPMEEARRSVRTHYLDKADVDRDDLQSANQELAITEIDATEQWLDLTAKVVDLWEPQSDAIAQVGLLGDETGTIKFTKWTTSDLPELDHDHVYQLGNVVTDEYQGRYSVKLNRTTTIEQVDTDIEVGDTAVERVGTLVEIQSGSGLIKRCPEDDCTHVLQNGRCSEHGEGDGEFDLRIKGVIDDGDSVQEVICDQETTERLSGLSLDDATEMAMDALDTSVVAGDMRRQLLGRYYRVTGPIIGRYLLVNEVERLNEPADHEAVLLTARSI